MAKKVKRRDNDDVVEFYELISSVFEMNALDMEKV